MRIFFSSRLVFRDILIIKQGCDQHSDKVKTWGSGFYLLKKRREGRLECLFGVLLLLKIGLEISFSYELSPWYKVPYVFSQLPHLSELEHHSRYLVYRLAGVIDRLHTPTGCWRIPIIILQRVEVRGCEQEVLKDIVGVNFACTSCSPEW